MDASGLVTAAGGGTATITASAGEASGTAAVTVAQVPLRVPVDNRRVADALEAQGIDGIEVVDGRGPYVRDWSASALADADVAVVLADDWGTARLVETSVGPLRAFTERGGGLIVAASALHWNWWIEQRHGPLTANGNLSRAHVSRCFQEHT